MGSGLLRQARQGGDRCLYVRLAGAQSDSEGRQAVGAREQPGLASVKSDQTGLEGVETGVGVDRPASAAAGDKAKRANHRSPSLTDALSAKA